MKIRNKSRDGWECSIAHHVQDLALDLRENGQLNAQSAVTLVPKHVATLLTPRALKSEQLAPEMPLS